jgi:hypothetical protein
MANLNLLTEGLVKNGTASGIREVKADELDILLDLDGADALTTVSGEVIDLIVDLGFLNSVESLKYKTTPLSTSGLIIKYGRELNSLITGTLQVVGEEIVVYPTASGYTYPRYFTLTHTTTGITLDHLIIENTEEEIDFGATGSLQGVTLVSPIAGGYSDVVEVPVFNSGSITTDIYVSVDISRTSRDIFENLEIAPAVTGTFYAVDPNNVPDNIPWQWGIFDKSTVDNDNNLVIIDTTQPTPGTQWSTGNVPGSYEYRTRSQEDVLKGGALVYPRFGDNSGFKLQFINAVAKTIAYSPGAVPYGIASNNTNKYYLQIAYDGENTLYWLRGISNSGGAREIYKYDLVSNTYSLVTSSVPDYNTYSGKGLIYHKGYLYILGGTSLSQVDNVTGTLVTRYHIATGTFTSMSPLPQVPNDHASFTLAEDYIYYSVGATSVRFYRYDLNENSWTMLPDWPGGTGSFACAQLGWNQAESKIWGVANERESGVCTGSQTTNALIYIFDTETLTWESETFTAPCFNQQGTSAIVYEMALLNKGTIVFYRGDTDYAAAYVLDYPPISTTSTWLSPVFLVRQGISTSGTGEDTVVISGFDSFHRVLVDRVEQEDISMTVDENISVETFEVRASDTSPAGDNTSESFTSSGVDTDRHVIGTTGDVLMDQSVNGLEFNHIGGGSSISAGYLYLNQPFATTGKMQYKFWWNPPQERGTGSANDRTAFFIVPYLDTLNTGLSPVRDSNTFRRTGNELIRIALGDETDSTFFTSLDLFKGGTAGTSSYAISAVSGRYYEVIFILDWETGDYSIRFDGVLLGIGNIPLNSRLFFEPQHSAEFYSSSTSPNQDFTEYFRYLTVSRIGLQAREDFAASPLHVDDPLYGVNGSLQFTTITENSAILPVSDYLQVRLTFKATNADDDRVVSKVKFPPIIRLPQVSPGSSKSVYIRYNFPPSNSLLQEQVFLKAYMAVDKP